MKRLTIDLHLPMPYQSTFEIRVWPNVTNPAMYNALAYYINTTTLATMTCSDESETGAVLAVVEVLLDEFGMAGCEAPS